MERNNYKTKNFKFAKLFFAIPTNILMSSKVTAANQIVSSNSWTGTFIQFIAYCFALSPESSLRRKYNLSCKILGLVAMVLVALPVFSQAPGGVAGANLWLKANAGATASGTDLTGWTDQTATNTFTVSGNPKTGASAINFNNVIDFDGVGDYLTGNANITFQTLYAVIKRNNTSFNSTVMGVSTSVATNIGYIMKGDKLATGNNNIAYFQSTGSLGIDKARLGVVEIVAGATATGNKTFIDGTSYSTEVLSLDGTFNTYSDIPHIGRSQRTTEQDYFNGQIAELIMYPASHSDIDRRKIQSYLALKYGITIPGDYLNSGGTTIWDATANAVYHNDVFGIGQDNGSGLTQSASNSINTGAGDGNPVVGNGNLYIGATPANLANGDFLIVGHNNGSLSEQTSDVPTGIYNRIGREWKVDHTGDVGTLTITFDKDGLTLAANRHFSLLIDADGDGDFTTGTVNRVASSFILQDRVYFRNVSLPDNAVITVATLAEPIGSASLWLKADAGVTESSGNLTNWTDQAGHNSFTKIGTVSYSDNSINFNPAVVFQNTNSQTVDPANSLNGNTEITYVDGFAVYKYTSANTGALMGSTDLGDNYGKAIFGSNADNKLYVGNGTNGKYQSFDYPNLQGNYLLGNFDVSPTDSPYATGRLNGANQTITTAGGGDFSSIHIKPMIGGTHSSGNAVDWLPFHGEVAEIVLFPTSLSGLDKQEVESYLAIKYGIHLAGNYLDGGGTTIWDATANSTYHNDVFGIGKEDGNGLNQTQSNSINTGSGNGTGQSGKGNIVLSSASNLGTGEFLMVGHNNEALTEQTSDVPVNLAGEERLTREWKVSVTGVPGSVDLSFETTSLTLTGTALADFILLIDTDNDGDFTTGTVTELSPVSFTSGVLVFENVTFANGNVFTFATGRALNTWNGSSWSYGYPPNNNIDALIDGDYDLGGSVDLITKQLVINAGNTVTINPGQKLSVSGHMVNNGGIVFKSDATGSGHFDSYTSSPITGSGSVQTERYIPARRAFRFLSPSVTTTGTIRANWQEGGSAVAGLGTHITGAGGATSGFDVTTTNNPSMFIYDTAQSWTAVANTNSNTLTAGFPYRLMVRGDRTVSLSTNTPTPTVTVLRSTGSLKTGDFSPSLATGMDQFSFIGNPYQAPIDIKAVLSASTNMNKNAVYYWDPTLNTRGGYVTRDLVSDSNSPSSSFNQYLQPGQAVFVQKDNTATAPTLTITENHKSVINSAPGVFKLKNNTLTNTTSVLRFNLNSNAVSNTVLDGGLILFSSAYDSNVDSQDLVKLGNLDEQVSIKLQNKALAIAKQSIPNDQDEIPLEVLNYRNTNYTWNFNLQNYSGPTPFLYDSLNQTYTEIVDSGSYSFAINNQNPLTVSPDRFKIKFTNKTLSTANFDLKTIVLYPNPITNVGNQEFTLTNVPSGAKIKLYSILGQELPIDVAENNGNFRVKSTSQLSKGIYFVKITQGQQASEFKLIVE